MAYKLMAVDMDGTLLDSNGKITEETKKAILAAVEKGLIFTISTGRPIQGVQPYVDELELDLPFITYNGAMVVMGKSRKILYEKCLSEEDAQEVIRLGDKFGTTVIVWANNKLYVREINDRIKKYTQLARTQPTVVENFEEAVKGGATKILWYDEVETIDRYEKEIGPLLKGNINFHTSQPFLLEFVDKNASKAIAMEKLGEYYGIDRSEMIAVGDGSNDLSMIEYAGLGVAMANAKDEVKEKADYITLSNDEDGVAHVIYKFVLGAE